MKRTNLSTGILVGLMQWARESKTEQKPAEQVEPRSTEQTTPPPEKGEGCE